MTAVGISTLIIVFTNVLCSYPGLIHHVYLEDYAFEVGKILIQKDYKRLLTSGFFHINGAQLVLNMVTLCLFSGGFEANLGVAGFVVVYLVSLVGGNLFCLFMYRNHGDYGSVGSTGAVTGIIFAAIALFPGFEIGFFGMRLPIPGWFYGFLYVLFSLYGVTSKKDNIGHEAHLAGGLTGLMLVLLLQPASLSRNYFAIFALAAPTIFFIYIIVTKPRFLFIESNFFNDHNNNFAVDPIYQSEKADHQKEIDLILEKIHQNGIGSLSKKEKEKLDYYSRIIQ